MFKDSIRNLKIRINNIKVFELEPTFYSILYSGTVLTKVLYSGVVLTVEAEVLYSGVVLTVEVEVLYSMVVLTVLTTDRLEVTEMYSSTLIPLS